MDFSKLTKSIGLVHALDALADAAKNDSEYFSQQPPFWKDLNFEEKRDYDAVFKDHTLTDKQRETKFSEWADKLDPNFKAQWVSYRAAIKKAEADSWKNFEILTQELQRHRTKEVAAEYVKIGRSEDLTREQKLEEFKRLLEYLSNDPQAFKEWEVLVKAVNLKH